MTLAVKETVNENQNSIGSLDEEKSLYRIECEVEHYDINDDDKEEISWSDNFKYIILATCEEEARDILEIHIQERFLSCYEIYFDEIKKLSQEKEIIAELCHLQNDTVKKRVPCGILDFRKIG